MVAFVDRLAQDVSRAIIVRLRPARTAKLLVIFTARTRELVVNATHWTMEHDLHVFTPENLLAQAATADEHLGYKILSFYVDEAGILSKAVTAHRATFYLSPSGGTLRDEHLNIVLYSAKFDLYKGFGRA